MHFLKGVIFYVCFKSIFNKGLENAVLSCESKLAMLANLWSDFFIIFTIFYSWNET